MAIEKRLRVTRKQTLDGRVVRFDKDGKPVVKISILPVRALNGIKAANTRLLDGLKMDYEIVDFDTKTRKVIIPKETPAKADDTEKPKKGPKKKKLTGADLDAFFNDNKKE